jgi:hypothetical protein
MTVIDNIILDKPLPPTQHLIDKPCWGVAAGVGTGSDFVLHFGDKRKRQERIQNSALPQELQEYEGDVMLYVECGWILIKGNREICSSDSDNGPKGAMVKGLNRLKGAFVKSALLSTPTNSLTLGLSKNLELIVIARNLTTDNYTILLPDAFYTAGPKGRGRWEDRHFS